MMQTPGWRVLERLVRDRQLAEQKAIIQGRCVDFVDYKNRCSFTDGMEFVTTLPGNTISRMEDAVRHKLMREEANESQA